MKIVQREFESDVVNISSAYCMFLKYKYSW